jgi:hypothetical protein
VTKIIFRRRGEDDEVQFSVALAADHRSFCLKTSRAHKAHVETETFGIAEWRRTQTTVLNLLNPVSRNLLP